MKLLKPAVLLAPLSLAAACDPFCITIDSHTVCFEPGVEPLVRTGDGEVDGEGRLDVADIDGDGVDDIVVGGTPGGGGPGCHGFAPATFDFPRDALSCDGPQYVRYDETYRLYVGVVSCGADMVRLYLSAAAAGPFLPATDTAGHGQDQCELVRPGFTLGHEDGISSGNCPECSTSMNLPLERVPTWTRANFGEPFVLEVSGEWSWQTSQLGCGVDVGSCAAPALPDDVWLPGDEGLPPSSDVPCEPGSAAWMSHPISARDMASGASDDTGPGFCVSLVVFGDALPDAAGNGANGMTGPCDDAVHCGTVVYGDGDVEPRLCTAFARCEDGLARTTGYTW